MPRVELGRIAARSSPAAMVVDEDTARLREMRHLLPPDQRVAARSMGERDRGPVAVNLVVEFGAFAADDGHEEV